jgi:ABC-2 type transport system permease protein
MIFGRFFILEWIIRSGDFDRYLIRPLPPFLQIMVERLRVSSFGDLLGGVFLFFAASRLVPVDWSPPALIYLALAILGGCLLESALKICASMLAFRFLQVGNAVFLVETVFSNFGNYPLKIFGGSLEFLLTFVFPLAFVAYFPATVLLAKTGELRVAPIFALLAPLAGAIWFAFALLVWKNEMRHYQSAGH